MLMTGILLGVACTWAVGRLIHTLRQKHSVPTDNRGIRQPFQRHHVYLRGEARLSVSLHQSFTG